MRDLIEAIAGELEDRWLSIATALLFMAIGWFFGRLRAKALWKKKYFFDRINVSMNSIRDGTLRIRTILEKSCLSVFPNQVSAESLIALAQRTTEQDSIIPLPKDEYWYYLNAVLNEVSETFATGHVRRDLGLPVNAQIYVICLTNERSGEMKTNKLRAMLIQKEFLLNLPKKMPTFERPHHKKRWETLQQLAAEYHKSPFKFLEMEIVI